MRIELTHLEASLLERALRHEAIRLMNKSERDTSEARALRLEADAMNVSDIRQRVEDTINAGS